jgi:hypothetical protein
MVLPWLLAVAWLSGTAGTDNFLQDEVTVPSGAKPGQQVVVMTTMAAQFIVTVPPGVLAGHTFPVHVPATAGRVSPHAFIDARTEMPSATEDTNDETQYRVQDIQTAMADRMDNDTQGTISQTSKNCNIIVLIYCYLPPDLPLNPRHVAAGNMSASKRAPCKHVAAGNMSASKRAT